MSKTRSPFARPTPNSRQGLRLVRNDATDEADVFIYDEIGYWGIDAKTFAQELKGVTASTIHLRLNSPGGGVFDGAAIYNTLAEHPAKVITHVDGVAASIASVIALAGDEIIMAENAFLMIHDPWTISMGTAAQLRKDADVVDKLGTMIVNTYTKTSGADEKQVRAWMQAETWFDAQEAVDNGFATEIAGVSEASASAFDLSIFAHAPERLVASAGAQPTIRDLERSLRDAGLSRSDAKAFVALGTKALTPQRDAGTEELLSRGRDFLAAIQSSH